MKKVETFLFIIYKIVFDLMYINIISVRFEYMGMYKDFNILKYIIGWMLFLCLIFIINEFLKKNISLYITKLFLILSMMPQLSLWGIKNYSYKSIATMILYWIIFIFSLKLLDKIRITKKTTSKFKENNKNDSLSSRVFVLVIFIFSIFVVIFISLKYTNFRFTISLKNVYEYRQAYANMTKPLLINYILPLVSTVLLPYCFMIYLIEKKYILSFVTLIIGILSFSITGMKTWLFIYLVILFFSLWGNRIKVGIINFMLIFLIVFTLIAASTYYISGNIELIGLHNRMLCYPSEINFYYFNFFSNHELLFLRESILRYFFQSPYDIKTPYLISHQYGGDNSYTNNMVNGLFGDAYANFGLIGVILYPIMLSIVMRIMTSLLEFYNDYRYSYNILLIIIWNSINTSFFTWLLTGGVILYCVVLYLGIRSKRLIIL